jgi:hypothetical protein
MGDRIVTPFCFTAELKRFAVLDLSSAIRSLALYLVKKENVYLSVGRSNNELSNE